MCRGVVHGTARSRDSGVDEGAKRGLPGSVLRLSLEQGMEWKV